MGMAIEVTHYSPHDVATSLGLMVRSVAKQRVSNHGAAPSFETALRASSG
jgi:hypothetical protein